MGRSATWLAAVPLALAFGHARADTVSPAAGETYLRLGAAGLFLETNSKLEVGGETLPGAGTRPSNVLTGAAEFGVFVRPDVSLSLIGGVPPEVDVHGRGSLDALGKLGAARLGFVTLLVDYHFGGLGRLQPYVSLGPLFSPVFSTTDAAATRLRVDDAWGVAFQAGFDYMITPGAGFYVDLSQDLLGTTARATIGGVPVTLKATLNPVVAQTGLTLRF